MNNVTTYKTSLELEANGFPQPEKAFGQIWYAKKDYNGLIKAGERLVCVQGSDDPVFASETEGHVLYSNRLNLVYAPRDTDILPKIQELSRAPFWWGIVPPQKDSTGDCDNEWSCTNFEGCEGKNFEITDPNPAEACARALKGMQK